MLSSVLISLIKDNVTALKSSSNTLPPHSHSHSPRIIDETQKYLKDVKSSTPSSDEVSDLFFN